MSCESSCLRKTDEDRIEVNRDVTSVNCLLATQMLTGASSTREVSAILGNLNQQINLPYLPQKISLRTNNLTREFVTGLDIDFFENRLVTYFQGNVNSIKLSNALGIICDLSEIFDKFQSAKKTPLIEDEFTNALDIKNTSDVKLTIDGKEFIAFYPLNRRVVLSTSRRQSSLPMEMIQNCSHLFNREFAREICPLLGMDPNLKSLFNGIYKFYLGRCILGLVKSMAIQSRGRIGHERELARIVSLIKMPNSAFYTEPLI